ncbi:MAG: oxygen-independent coproporphyrinogen-3 oxidase [Alteromonas naphthalenivorans]
MSFNRASQVRSLYIHWPFCPYKCSFCPFVAFSGWDRFMGEYHKALTRELKEFKKEITPQQPLDTIYIGGGTPSTWPDELLLDTFATLESMFDFNSISEITIEANPGTVCQEQLDIWKKAGITRLSIGVQSLDDAVLEKLNRNQKADDVRRLMKWADGKFNSLSIDLIVGLPGISEEQWKEQVLEIMTWPIQHISMYFLSIHEGTGLYFKLQRKNEILPPDDQTVDLYYWTIDMFAKHGFEQYEVSSFAKKGYESKHNQAYWDRKLYKGVGVGAWSFDGDCRFQNEKQLMRYIDALGQGDSALSYKEKVTQDEARFEIIMLGLRKMSGVPIAQAIDGLCDKRREKFFEQVSMLKEKKFIEQKGDRLFLTKTALSVENEIAVKLSV